jgi:nicotinamidase/pyrazinamidase
MKTTLKRILVYTGITVFLIVAVPAVNLFIFSRVSERISKGSLIPEYERERSALLVIDIQEYTTGTVSQNHSYQEQADKLISGINVLSARADSAGIPVVYITAVVTNPLVNILNSSLATGSEGTQLDRRLQVVSPYVLTKKRNDSFTNPELDTLLRNLKVNHLYLTGLDASHCVNCTLRGALNRGYRVSVIEDGVIAANPDQKTVMMKQFRELGVKMSSSDRFPESP